MAHLCVPQNQALGVCRGFVPDIQICGTHGRKDLVNATIISNAEEEEEEGTWRYSISVRTGWPVVKILCLGEIETGILKFYFSVAARTTVSADPSLRGLSARGRDVRLPRNNNSH